MIPHRAVLFDVDGVLLDTGGLFQDIWRGWAARRGLDPAAVVARTLGRRTADVLRDIAPHLDSAVERRALDALTVARLGEVRAVPGASEVLRALGRTPWGIVTSGSAWFVRQAFPAAGLQVPTVAVYGEDVRRGKPAPEGYLRAARRLGVPPADCVVVEDAPDGITAARDAGCTVVAVATTRDPDQLTGAHLCVSSLSSMYHLMTTILAVEQE